MKNMCVLAEALAVIEERLLEPVRLDDVAGACYVSPSALQKLFRYALHCSVSEYTAKRRLSEASRELVATERSVTDIALGYQYGSPEAFSRAFKRFWGISPSAFRRERRFTDLFPKLSVDNENGGYTMPGRRKVDIGDLYDELKNLRDTWVLCVDVCSLTQINDISYAAGDLAIAEAAARIEGEISPDMLMFRVGGDEFAVVTGCVEKSGAEALRERISARNTNPFAWEGREIPLSLRFGTCKIPAGNLRYHELYTDMQAALENR